MNLPYPWEARANISLMQNVVRVVVAVGLVIVLGWRYRGPENLSTDVTPGALDPCET